MLGNDLVDLNKAAIESNWARPGYLEKIFTYSEIQAISSSEIPNILVWLFWTMKEAAYKIVNRKTGQRFYAPLTFNCVSINLSTNEASGTVNHKEEILFTKSNITDKFIHTLALEHPEGFENVMTLNLPNSTDYITVFNAKSVNYKLHKDERGLPVVTNLQTLSTTAASVSHHGDFLTIAHFQS